MAVLSPKHLLSSAFQFLVAMATTVDVPSLNPPLGNSPYLRVVGKGYQVYRCEQEKWNLWKYKLIHAEADLYENLHATITRRNILGYHYFLQYMDGGGGKPTWSMLSSPGDNNNVPPSSTATFKVIANVSSTYGSNVASLLLRATSHSGDGPLSKASYVQRLNTIGGVSPSFCFALGEDIKVPYTANYVFWSQDAFPNSSFIIPSSLLVPPGNILVASYFGQGFQIYSCDRTSYSWVLQNVSASISSAPGNPTLGKHFFLSTKDNGGGQPTWEIYSPQSKVTAKPLVKANIDESSIPWLIAQSTSHTTKDKTIDRCSLGVVSYIQRLSTSGGNPPLPSYQGACQVGDVFESPYSALYFFYAPTNRM